ncbi:hypothetical protein DLN99_23295 [Salmonella enterica]|nr:hypothetical protein [Salmonella enterica]
MYFCWQKSIHFVLCK